MYSAIKRKIENELVPIALLILSFFIFTALLLFAVELYWQQGAKVRKEVTWYKTHINSSSKYEELKNKIKEKQKLLEQKHTELTQGLADPHDLAGLLQMIFDKAWQVDIQFDKTVPQDEQRKKDYIHYPVLLEMTTDYISLGKFISSLELMPQIVHIDRVGINAKTNKKIQARMLITCFLRLHK